MDCDLVNMDSSANDITRFLCEVDPRKKRIKVITILNGDMKLKQGTPKIITESIAESLEYILLD